MDNKTPLYSQHCSLNAKLVDFAGFSMPLHYGSQLQEHLAVRQGAGMFDVSHMAIVDISGTEALPLLRRLLANDAKKLQHDGSALYSCLLNDQGGILDDLIVYRLAQESYRLILNASQRQVDLDWISMQASTAAVSVTLRDDLALLAVQGPNALAQVACLFDKVTAAALLDLQPFTSLFVATNTLIARTGYTGEHGVEIMLPAEQVAACWSALLAGKVVPCGLGARDTLRLEAGFNLYGADMNEQTTPAESNLAWTVCWQDKTRDFIGRTALEQQHAAGVTRRLVGVMMKSPGVLRCEQTIHLHGKTIGHITSGSFSPTLRHAIGLARIALPLVNECVIERRGQSLPIELVKPPFVRFNQPTYQEYRNG